jgi:hypothetical protein
MAPSGSYYAPRLASSCERSTESPVPYPEGGLWLRMILPAGLVTWLVPSG